MEKLKSYIKMKLQSIDGVYDNKKPFGIKGEEPKQLPDSFVKSENENYKITGIIYKEVKSE